MLRLTKHLALLLALCWLPAALHCQLEQAGLAPLLGCADQPATADRDDCAADACQIVESGQLALAHSRIELPALVAAIVPELTSLLAIPAPLAGPTPLPRDRAPLAEERTWQFTRRAVAPARAPDVLNT